MKNKSFIQYQRECGFFFTLPEKFAEEQVKALPNLKHDLCLSQTINKDEIRYSFFVGEMSTLDAYNSFNKSNFMNLIQNDSSAIIHVINKNDTITNERMNSDLAEVITFDIKSNYGKGFKYCTMISIHKRDVTNLYITLLFNDIDNNEDLIDSAVRSLKFTDNENKNKDYASIHSNKTSDFINEYVKTTARLQNNR